MSDPADTFAISLELLASTASAVLAHRDSLLDRAHNQGLSDAVAKRLSDRRTQGLFLTPPTSNQSVSGLSTSSNTNVSLASNRSASRKFIPSKYQKRAKCCGGGTRPLTTDRFRVLRSPKVVISRSNRMSLPLQVSQLQSRAVTESWEDDEIEIRAPNLQVIPEDSSDDELLHDTPRPNEQAGAPKLPKATKKVSQRKLEKPTTIAPKSHAPAIKVLAAQLVQGLPIDWAFWIQEDNEIGFWRPLSDFPSATQVQFKLKFDADFLQTPRHMRLWAAMLKNCDNYLNRDICVGNTTYRGRKTPSKWTIAGGNKERTCDTCLRAKRFCARMVKVGEVVRLGFFPAAIDEKPTVDWQSIHRWVG